MELEGFGEIEGTELLQKVPIFARLSFEETSHLARILVPIDVAAGAVIIEQNALGDALYVLHAGTVAVTRELEGPDGSVSHDEVGRLGPGELFGEMALMDDLLTSARVSALSDCHLLQIPRPAFEALLASNERLAVKVYRSFCRTLSDRLRRANELLAARQARLTTVR